MLQMQRIHNGSSSRQPSPFHLLLTVLPYYALEEGNFQAVHVLFREIREASACPSRSDDNFNDLGFRVHSSQSASLPMQLPNFATNKKAKREESRQSYQITVYTHLVITVM